MQLQTIQRILGQLLMLFSASMLPPVIVSLIYRDGAAPAFVASFFVTLAAGFKGGEVTPLFFIGATLGNTLAWVLGAPVELFAALGLATPVLRALEKLGYEQPFPIQSRSIPQLLAGRGCIQQRHGCTDKDT